MTLVERFIDFSDWPTSRKTALGTMAICSGHLLAAGLILLLRPAALDVPLVIVFLVCGFILAAATAMISWLVYRRGRAGRWTGYLLIYSYGTLAVGFLCALGPLTTPFLAYPVLLPLFIGLWFDARMGAVAFAYGFGMLAVVSVLILADVIPFAPAMELRAIDDMKTLTWSVFVYFVILAVALLVCLLGFVAVAAADLQRRRLVLAHGLIRRYVPEQVADAVLSGAPETIDRHERRKLTIFFSDVVGFTDLSDELEPEDLATVLHDYFTEMSAIAHRHAGTVDDLVGDAILVLFGAPESTDDHDQALRAVRMAVEMQEAMALLNRRWESAGIPDALQVRMGVNTGVVTVGNFGSADRTKYTALGKQVNVAARIQSQCEPGKVLISHPTWLLVRDEITCVPKGELVLKGLHKPMPAYEVQG